MTIVNHIRAVQRMLRLADDGIAGPVTWEAIQRAVEELERLKAGDGMPGVVSVVPGQAPWGGSGDAGPTDTGNLGSAKPGHPGAVSGPNLATPDKFWSIVRRDVLGGKLLPSQFEGIEALLNAMAGWPLSWVAYGLATAKLETAATMQPIKEMGGAAYLKRMYDIEGARPAKARELGNLSPGDGVKYAGRGYVQLTGKTNYAKASAALGVDLVGNPDLAMRPGHAATILRWGMSTGAFTGRKLGDYLAGASGTLRQYTDARRIINGQDRAVEIARLAEKFQAALAAGGWS